MKRLFLLLLCVNIFILNVLNAQDFSHSEIVTVDGQQYILHPVARGETLFSLSRIYKVEQKDIVSANPQLIFGLKQGDVLKIPYEHEGAEAYVEQQTRQITSAQIPQDEFIFHVVKKSETVYSISRQYNVSVNSIYRFNPEAEVEILENEILRIPKSSDIKVESGLMREDSEYYYHQVQPQETVYSLAREYEVKVADIFEQNTDIGDHIEIGQIIRIPKAKPIKLEKQVSVTKNFFEHRVESGDTFFSYQRRFGVTSEQLIDLNPELADGLQAGQLIKVPVQEARRVEVVPENSESFIEHEIRGGETLFGISQQYDVNIPRIRDFNPELRTRGLITGETILIPRKVEEREEQTSSDEVAPPLVWPGTATTEQDEIPDHHRVSVEFLEPEWMKCPSEYEIFTDDTFRVSMFLPLFFDTNDSINKVWFTDTDIARMDSLKAYDEEILEKYYEIIPNSWGDPVDTVLVKPFTNRENRYLLARSRFFVNFYQGFLLAMDSMQNAGINVKLNLYDSELSKFRVDSLLYTHDFINSDLIIGPVLPEMQQAVSEFSSKNRIPMVSPFSNNDILVSQNPYYFQVNPSKEYLIKKTSDYIGDAFYDKNFIVMTLGKTEQLKEADLTSLVRDKFFLSGFYRQMEEIRFAQVDFTEGGHMGYWQVKRNLRPDMENVIFIPATENQREREALLSRAINSLQVLSEEFEITLVGMSDYPVFRSINTEYYHRLKLHYLTPNDINYSRDAVSRFIAKYRSDFYAEPDQYSFRGYDVGMYFIDAYSKMGEGFVECIEDFNPPLLQSRFNFQRIDALGGFMNHTLYIMNYTPDFKVKRVTTLTEGRLLVEH